MLRVDFKLLFFSITNTDVFHDDDFLQKYLFVCIRREQNKIIKMINVKSIIQLGSINID